MNTTAKPMPENHRKILVEAMSAVRACWDDLRDEASGCSFATWIDDDFDEFIEQLYGVLEAFDDPDVLRDEHLHITMRNDLRHELTEYSRRDYTTLVAALKGT